jgi:hypothetical protein
MIATLCWKEYREQRAMWLAIVILAVVCVLGLGALAHGGLGQANADPVIGPTLFAILVSLVVGHGIVCGAQLLGSEKEAGTLAFLDTLAARRAPLWQSKLAVGCLLMLTEASIVAGLTAFVDLEPLSVAFQKFLILGLLGLLWGMAGGAVCRSMFPAILLGAALMIGCLLLSQFLFVIPEVGLLTQSCFAGIGGLVSWRYYCESDKERRPVPQSSSKMVKRRGPIFQLLGSVGSIWWLAMRQGRWGILAGIVLSVFTGYFLSWWWIGIAWPTASLVVGIACGLCVFAFEQPGEQERFLGAQRFPPGRIWLAKIAFWFMTTVCMLALLFAAPFVIESAKEGATNRFGRYHSFSSSLESFAPRHGGLFLAMSVVQGFCFAQFAALLTRRIVVAAVLAVVASLLYWAIWLPAFIFGGVNEWHIFVVPLFVLLAGRMTMWPWLSGRLYSRKHIYDLTGCSLLSIAWLVGSFWLRVVEVPDVGEPFDLAAFDRDLSRAAQNESAQLLRRALEEMEQSRKKVEAKLGKPTKDLRGRLVSANSGGISYEGLASDILYQGWPAEDAEIGRWFDEMFAGPWADQCRKAAAMPPGLFMDPRTPGWDGTNSAKRCSMAACLFSARALQLQARGDDAAGLAHLETALALSRQIRHYASTNVFLTSLSMERSALSGFDRWLIEAEREPKRLVKGLTALRHHESLIPDVADNIKAEYVMIRRFIDIDLGRYLDHNSSLEKAVLNSSWHLPWERQRQLRLINAVFQSLVQNANTIRGASEYGLPLPEGPTTKLSADEWSVLLRDALIVNEGYFIFLRDHVNRGYGFVNVRARQLFIALALYEAEHKKSAAKLEDLVPAYLPTMPLDPYSNRPFFYKISAGEVVESRNMKGNVGRTDKLFPGQGVIWLELGTNYVSYFPVPRKSEKEEEP